MKKSFKDLEKTESENHFKQEVMIAFWFAVHTEKIDIAIFLAGFDPMIAQIIINLRESGQKIL